MPETTLEPVTDTSKKPAKARSQSAWTPEQARLFAAKSALVRAQRVAERKLSPKPTPITKPEPDTLKPEPFPQLDEFVSRTLARVRKQMTKLDRMMTEETEPAKLDRLAAAFGRLSEIERQLADRPLPGSKRPAPEKPGVSRSALLLGGPATEGQGQVEQE